MASLQAPSSLRFSWTNARKATKQKQLERHIPPVDNFPEGVYGGRLHGRRIRLLRLLPRPKPDSLTYEMVEHDLDSRVGFEALSYSWGDPTPKHMITCNGKDIRIAGNLHDALQQFQQDGGHPLLWADALCINQADLDEKSEQVQLMGEIYKAASEVVVWLGMEKPSDRNGVVVLSLLLENMVFQSV